MEIAGQGTNFGQIQLMQKIGLLLCGLFLALFVQLQAATAPASSTGNSSNNVRRELVTPSATSIEVATTAPKNDVQKPVPAPGKVKKTTRLLEKAKNVKAKLKNLAVKSKIKDLITKRKSTSGVSGVSQPAIRLLVLGILTGIVVLGILLLGWWYSMFIPFLILAVGIVVVVTIFVLLGIIVLT